MKFKQLCKEPFLIMAGGLLIMAVPFLMRHVVPIAPDLTDFIKGLGVGIILASFFLMKKVESK